ncbi:zinc-ribbon domain-containing protein [Flagellimonas lutimaris]|uniref:Zinc-ribbon domain-containing protein n=1 Tax=Flagellimonas lutimaris TaxID=475082 RepID=A0A3A1NAT2_9FLAO|nr:zinc-ribbon domain-containing protein [Allomuricauda lutimaris]RIV35986.1 zinc-ribbon domain-containing protein [Allomuricauda lutimaris]
MIIFGLRSSKIGGFPLQGVNCDYCNTKTGQSLLVFGKYAHIFWIPLFPIGKRVFSECMHCKKTSNRKEFTAAQEQGYQEHKHQAKTPLWHWAWIIVFLIAVIAIVGLGIIRGAAIEN